ncbi:phage tail protein [Streptomyces sp. NPDC056049]|uniref:phage tail protein n=1 Tax=Streptomyces sp. NPDC056049 TaxID=3345693 RepID=UPI0035D7DE0F
MAESITYTNTEYPVPTYRFVLDIDGDGKTDATFGNVSGLNITHQAIEYKDGMGGWFQMPGQVDATNVTLRKGLIPKDSPLFDWISTVTLNTVEKKDCTITLTNEDGTETFIEWTLTGVFPVSVTSPNLKDGSTGEATIDEVSLLAKSVNVKFS